MKRAIITLCKRVKELQTLLDDTRNKIMEEDFELSINYEFAINDELNLTSEISELQDAITHLLNITPNGENNKELSKVSTEQTY